MRSQCIYLASFEICVVQAGVELAILLHQLHNCWAYRYMPLCQIKEIFEEMLPFCGSFCKAFVSEPFERPFWLMDIEV